MVTFSPLWYSRGEGNFAPTLARRFYYGNCNIPVRLREVSYPVPI